MYSTLVTLALLAVPAFATFTVDTPVFTQCQPATLTWAGAASGPVNAIVVGSDDPCGDAVADLGDLTGTSHTWTVALPSGKAYELSLEDADGNEAWSGSITVGPSSDSSCLSNAVVVPSGSSSTSGGSGNAAQVLGGGSTVIVTPTSIVSVTTTSTPVAGGSSSGSGLAGAVGGVGNAGANPLGLGSGALAMRQASTPVMVLGALAAMLVASL